VTAVLRSGPWNPSRRVIHVLDYHALPDDLARADGHDPEELALEVDRVQGQQAVLLERLHGQGVGPVYLEGLTAGRLPAWEARLAAACEAGAAVTGLREGPGPLRPGPDADDARARIDALEGRFRSDVRELGALALLARRGVRLEALPLDEERTLEAASPRLIGGRPVIDEKAKRARQEAMVKLLPDAGLVVAVLGGGHDLGPALGERTEYVRVELAAYREAMKR
jgi:hypothetical protein